ncbi:flagellar basal body rod protein FlgC [Salipiger sp. IMCC34102]|uniref:flagellar basal body rod protein FlgC n=1 Tax=Salipiger sp. IMCC34102 TaxID=2510647 RepID=UPI00101C3E46|nr:flagellar basal body rod protein FlgC [Salipiger sp. IMCC34102]RYH01572.1 flagellar basal body rod protein FlgC [Salipiger sp. IMCC34102]
MTDFADARSIITSGMRAQAARLRHVSENIANADTPGFRRKTISFEAVRDSGAVRVGRMELDRTPLPQVYDPGHVMADERGYYEGSNVNLLMEVTDAREAQRSYEANLKMFDQVRQMNQGLLDLLRR